ncbi:MAG TPA: zinc-binding alcohol dehydrogenase [Candidatus Nanopelagicales bacterium]|nr:zinc-binding alcohol dehydrogenase [Candidatus Nanopelagicales bacterium]
MDARAFWITGPGTGDIRDVALADPGADDVVVRTLFTGISRGTERLVSTGRVPESQREVMRAPFQDGDFPWPVKYGYLNVGLVESGPARLVDRAVFSLYPHQTRYVVPATAVTPLPDGLPPERAVLAGTMETAINALWDAAPLIGDDVAVVGAGMVGCCVARLLSRMPGVRVTLVDTDTSRREVAEALDAEFATPGTARGARDLVVHTSATSAGLQTSLALLAPDAEVIELSWYGDTEVTLALGGSFHSSRLAVRASQVGAIARSRRDRRTTGQRLELALNLLRDPALDVLLTGRSDFDDLPSVLPQVVDGRIPALCHVISYGEG